MLLFLLLHSPLFAQTLNANESGTVEDQITAQLIADFKSSSRGRRLIPIVDRMRPLLCNL